MKTMSRCPGFLKRIEAMGGHLVSAGLFLPEETSGENTNDVIFEKFTVDPALKSSPNAETRKAEKVICP